MSLNDQNTSNPSSDLFQDMLLLYFYYLQHINLPLSNKKNGSWCTLWIILSIVGSWALYFVCRFIFLKLNKSLFLKKHTKKSENLLFICEVMGKIFSNTKHTCTCSSREGAVPRKLFNINRRTRRKDHITASMQHFIYNHKQDVSPLSASYCDVVISPRPSLYWRAASALLLSLLNISPEEGKRIYRSWWCCNLLSA